MRMEESEQKVPGKRFFVRGEQVHSTIRLIDEMLNFQIAKIHTITLHTQTLNAIPRK